VSSKITGKVVEVNVEEGMAVTEGQVLARLDDATLKAGLALADVRVGDGIYGTVWRGEYRRYVKTTVVLIPDGGPSHFSSTKWFSSRNLWDLSA
jgi:pyruvate/2-oxoglutarate dehydrogenase complex dihydrolipoamide acyltransferase (E2) component